MRKQKAKFYWSLHFFPLSSSHFFSFEAEEEEKKWENQKKRRQQEEEKEIRATGLSENRWRGRFSWHSICSFGKRHSPLYSADCLSLPAYSASCPVPSCHDGLAMGACAEQEGPEEDLPISPMKPSKSPSDVHDLGKAQESLCFLFVETGKLLMLQSALEEQQK